MSIVTIQKGDMTYALVVRPKDMKVEKTQFYTSNEATLQVGMIAHRGGYIEKPHYHRENKRTITGTWETLHVTKGIVAVDFFDPNGKKFKSVKLNKGDLILLMDGVHRIRVIKSFAGMKVKQGPYISLEMDKVNVDER